MKFIVECPCNGYSQEYTVYEEASRDLKHKNMYGCGMNCAPYRHKFNIIEDETVLRPEVLKVKEVKEVSEVKLVIVGSEQKKAIEELTKEGPIFFASGSNKTIRGKLYITLDTEDGI